MRIPCRILSLLLCLTAAATGQELPKTGTFTTTFTDRSPLTSKEELSKRFSRADLPAYDLTQQSFLIHVPEDYTPATPHGLILFLNYKDSESIPPLWLPILAKHHLIYAMDTHHDHAEPITASLSADAVSNLSKAYNIDSKRVYLIGVDAAETTALSFPDLFTGSLIWSRLEYSRPLTDPKTKGQFPAKLPKIQPAMLLLAKSRPILLATRPDLDDTTKTYHALVLKAFQQDGFHHLRGLQLTKDDFHYPNLTTPWLEDALTFFESPPPTATANPSAPTAARSLTTKPTLTDPQRLLALANYFIENKAYSAAQSRLQTIIDQYPNDPTAKEAQSLLDSITQKITPKLEWRTTTQGKQP